MGWNIPPSAFMAVVESDLVTTHRKIALAMGGEIVARAPIDTGLFMANNIVTVGLPIDYTIDKLDRLGSPTKSAMESALNPLAPYTVVYIQNNLPYAVKLETGSSKQAPAPPGIYAIAFRGVASIFR